MYTAAAYVVTHLAVVLNDLHLKVKSHKFAQMTVSKGVFSAENGPDFKHSAYTQQSSEARVNTMNVNRRNAGDFSTQGQHMHADLKKSEQAQVICLYN